MNRDEWNPNRQITNDAGAIADIMYWFRDQLIARLISKPTQACNGLTQRDQVVLYQGHSQGWRLL